MSNYAIIRTKKLKTVSNIVGSLNHNFREIETHNADPNKTPENSHLHPRHWGLYSLAAFGEKGTSKLLNSTQRVMQRFSERYKEITENGSKKPRKDAVLAIEYLLTASPEWWKTIDDATRKAWIKANLAWLEKQHGQQNIIACTYQVDETTPHIAAYVVPEKDGRFNAKHFLGGREKMRKMQNDYAKNMKVFGLERGIEGSKAKHQDIKQYYTQINETSKKIELPEPSFLETAAQYKKKIDESGVLIKAQQYDKIKNTEKLISQHQDLILWANANKPVLEKLQKDLNEITAELNKRIQAEQALQNEYKQQITINNILRERIAKIESQNEKYFDVVEKYENLKKEKETTEQQFLEEAKHFLFIKEQNEKMKTELQKLQSELNALKPNQVAKLEF